MPITSIHSNPRSLTLTVVGDYPVPVERLWQAYADPRQLERFWGPVEAPATFLRHDMKEGGRSEYFLTLPDGSRSYCWWRFLSVEPGRRFEVEDGFADENFQPNEAMPSMRIVFTFESTPTGSRMTSVTHFPDLEAMERIMEMGAVEGLKSALGQLDTVLADLASFAADRNAEAKILDDRRVRVSRIIRGTVEQVWRAHHEAELLQRWMLGPDGWRMSVCQVAGGVGEAYRYEWEAEDGSNRFGFEGQVVESEPPYREVTTERLIGMDGPPVVNEMTLTPIDGGTLLSLVITYPSAEVRDMVLGTGMVDGMERSYQRLEAEVLAAA